MLASLRRLLPYLARYRTTYAIGAVCVVASVALRFAVPRLLGDSIDVLRRAGNAGRGLPADTLQRLLLHGAGGIVLAALVGAVVRTTSRVLVLGNSRRAVHDVRRDLFERLIRLAPSFYVRHRTGEILSRCVNDMRNVQSLLGPVVLYLVETAVLFAVGLVFLLDAHPWLALVGLAPFPPFLWLAHRLAQRVQAGSRLAQEKLGELGAKVDESVGGHRVIKALVLEEIDAARLQAHAEDYARTMLAVARTRAALTAGMTFLAATSTLLVLAAARPLAAAGAVTVGEVVAAILYLGMLAAPTRTLGFVLSSLQRGAAALERIGEILDLPAEVDDAGADPDARITRGELRVVDLTVDVDDARAGGPGGGDRRGTASGRRRILEGVSFEAPAGATIAVVGPVGAGKSMLLRALARQVDVGPGHVFVDGHDLETIPLAELRRAIAMAPQDAFLFGDTLAENVRFGAPEAGRERVLEAVATAGLEPDVQQLEHGLDTVVGERGVMLSGGQRQRTSLARAALVRPRILLLDDTLSAVDAATAERILARLRPLMAECTTLIVAHRLATVRDADAILVLVDGKVVERGTHEELLASGGYYASVWRRQSERSELASELGMEEAS